MAKYYLAPRLMRSKYSKRAGGYPIWLRFTNGCPEAWKPTGVFIKAKEFWNDELKLVVGGPNAKLKNRVIEFERLEAEGRIERSIAEGEGATVAAFKGRQLMDLEAYMREVVKSSNVEGCIKHIKAYLGSVPTIEHITVKWLRRLEDYMTEEAKPSPKATELGLSTNSVKSYMAVLSKVTKQAVVEGFIRVAPFGPGLYNIPKPGKTTPTWLIEEERNEMLECLLTRNKGLSPEAYSVLAYFMLGCYSGLRWSDWKVFDYKSRIQGDMMILRTVKTDGQVTQKIHPGSNLEKVLAIIKQIGPLNIAYTTACYHLDALETLFNLHGKALTTHVGRHSFGYMCAAMGVSREATAYLMGISVKMVECYYHYAGKHMEEQSRQLANA